MQSYRHSLKRRLVEIDDELEDLSHRVKQMSDVDTKSELQCKIMSARLKKEKILALAAVARSQNLVAEMNLLIAENELNTDMERLKNSKKIKLDEDSHNKKEVLAPKKQVNKSSQTQTSPVVSTKSTSVSPQHDKKKPRTARKTKKSAKHSEKSKTSIDSKKSTSSTPNNNIEIIKEPNLCKTSITEHNKDNPSSIYQLKNELSSANTGLKLVPSSKLMYSNAERQQMEHNSKNKCTIECNWPVRDDGKNNLVHIAKHSMPTIICQPKYTYTGKNLSPKLINSNCEPSQMNYGSNKGIVNASRAEIDLDNDKENQHEDLVNDIFRDLLMSKNNTSSEHNNSGPDTSFNSAITVKLHEL